MRSKGDWPGSAKAATRGAAACAGSVLCGRICVGSGVCCHLSRPEARPQRVSGTGERENGWLPALIAPQERAGTLAYVARRAASGCSRKLVDYRGQTLPALAEAAAGRQEAAAPCTQVRRCESPVGAARPLRRLVWGRPWFTHCPMPRPSVPLRSPRSLPPSPRAGVQHRFQPNRPPTAVGSCQTFPPTRGLGPPCSDLSSSDPCLTVSCTLVCGSPGHPVLPRSAPGMLSPSLFPTGIHPVYPIKGRSQPRPQLAADFLSHPPPSNFSLSSHFRFSSGHRPSFTLNNWIWGLWLFPIRH